MKVTLLAAGLVATVFAQDLSSIPTCAQTCLADAITQDGQCQATDASCVCGRIDALTSLATGCVLSSCGQEVALNQVLPAVKTFCAGVGSGSGSGSSAPAGTSAAPTSASEPSAAPSSSPAPSSEPEATPSPTESSSSQSSSATPSHSGSGSAHTSGTSSPTATDASASPSSSVVTAGAAHVGSVGGLAAFILGAVAIF